MICSACGAESAPGQFCSNCGAELPVADHEQQANQFDEQDQSTQPTDEYGQQTYDTGDYEQQPHDAVEYDETAQDPNQFDEGTYEEGAYDDTSDVDQTYVDQPVDSSADLFSEGETETAATDDLFASEDSGDVGTTGAEAVADNEIVDKTKEAASDFGGFFIGHLKEPMKGVNATKDQLISSIITLSIFSFLIALNSVLMYRKLVSSGVFVDGFLMPLIGTLVLFAVISGITYAGITLTHKSGTFVETVSKVGALSVPFFALYFLAFLVSFMGIPRLFIILAVTSILGIAIVIPAIIILEKSSQRFDQVFVLLGITLVNLIVVSFVMSSLVQSILFGMIDDMMGGFMGGF